MNAEVDQALADIVRRVVREELAAALDELAARTATATAPARFVTIREAAGIASIGVRSIETAVAAGDLPVVRRGRSVRIDLDELDRWMAGAA